MDYQQVSERREGDFVDRSLSSWQQPADPAQGIRLHDLELDYVRARFADQAALHSDYVRGVAVTADGRRAVSASYDNTLKVWDLEAGQELRTRTGHWASVNTVAVTANWRRAVYAFRGKTLKVWDLESGQQLRTLARHSSYVYGVAATADGRRAVSASDDKTLKVWDLETGHELRTLAGTRLGSMASQ